MMPALEIADYEFTPLHQAVLGLGPNTAAEILTHYPSIAVDAEDSLGRTALWWAARRGDYQVTELLLRHHADPDKYDSHGIHPVRSAIAAQSHCCLRLLLRNGVDINGKNCWGYTTLMSLAQSATNMIVLDVLLEYGPELDAQGSAGDSALLIALESQRFDIATRLIQAGANIHVKEESGYNALSVAILFNAHAMIQLLLDRQADHHGLIEQFGTLLHLIAEVADIDTLAILTDNTLSTRSVRGKRHDGRTAMEVAWARTDVTIEWQNAFFAFLWGVDETKTRVAPFRPGDDQVRTEDSDDEGDTFHDALE